MLASIENIQPPKPALCHYEYLGFSSNPFPITPDADDFYLGERAKVLLSELRYLIDQRRGFAVLYGEVGAGKSTFIRYLLSQLDPAQYCTALVLNSCVQDEALFDCLLSDFDFSIDLNDSFVDKLAAFNRVALQRRREGKSVLVVIDDAQNLSESSLEMLRLLTNLETHKEKLVQIVLVGQQELLATIERPSLRQLKSRIALFWEFEALNYASARDYINFKLSQCTEVELEPLSISSPAVALAVFLSRRNSRKLNMILDRVLHVCVLDGDRTISALKLLRSHYENKLSSFVLYLFSAVALTLSLGFVGASLIGSEPSIDSPAIAETSASDQLSKAQASPQISPSATGSLEPQAWIAWLKSQGVSEAQLAPLKEHKNVRDLNLDRLTLSDGRRLLLLDANAQRKVPWSANDARRFVLANGDLLYLWTPLYTVDQLDFQRSRENIRQLQTDLKRLGVYQAPIDGLIGPKTFMAIVAFQQTQNRPQNGALDNLTLYLIQNINVVKL
jgi:general secretion pathway protein A